MSDFNVPEGYFENSKKSIMNSILAADSPAEFEVPSGYFEKSKLSILDRTQETKVVSIYSWKKIMLYAASAAAIALLIWHFSGQEQEIAQPSFADLLEQTDLNEETVLQDASLDEVVHFYSSEINTIVADTTLRSAEPNAAKEDSMKLQKITKPTERIKPNKKKEHPTIDELSEEEILKYLIEEGGDSYEIQ